MIGAASRRPKPTSPRRPTPSSLSIRLSRAQVWLQPHLSDDMAMATEKGQITERLQTLKVRLDDSWYADKVDSVVVMGPPTSTTSAVDEAEPIDEVDAMKEGPPEHKKQPSSSAGERSVGHREAHHRGSGARRGQRGEQGSGYRRISERDIGVAAGPTSAPTSKKARRASSSESSSSSRFGARSRAQPPRCPPRSSPLAR